ncbi:MAG TPA: hypothetical protein VNB06_10215 [Thermoanaerobaculia bacterium]|nr:hypothetical protein [Thermoanaerobaculia bacterium]
MLTFETDPAWSYTDGIRADHYRLVRLTEGQPRDADEVRSTGTRYLRPVRQLIREDALAIIRKVNGSRP